MATTGIWKIGKRLDNVIVYTTNVEKTKNSEYGKESYYDLHNVIDYVEADYKTEKQTQYPPAGTGSASCRGTY